MSRQTGIASGLRAPSTAAALASRHADPSPSARARRRLDATTLPRVLAGLTADGSPLNLIGHEQTYGVLPLISGKALIDELEHSGLRGRGGAGFPTALKLRTVAAKRRVSAVVVNASETEPASHKDGLLVSRLPHLVLDGAALAARAVGAREVIVRISDRDPSSRIALEAALAERTDAVPFWLSIGPDRYVSGEESAIVNALEDDVPLPRFTPPRPFERGYRRRPTLIQNAETLAHLALIGRFGSGWFRSLGTPADPGTMLVTLSGAIGAPGVFEVELGAGLDDLLRAAGGVREPIRAFLVGGYFGRWIAARDATGLSFERERMRDSGTSLGAGVVVALGESCCGLHETARVLRYLADQSAGQCGPCVYGLDAIATAFAGLVEGSAQAAQRERILHWAKQISGRGACHHPDGAIGLLRSALHVFEDEIALHAGGACRRHGHMLPTGPGADMSQLALRGKING